MHFYRLRSFKFSFSTYFCFYLVWIMQYDADIFFFGKFILIATVFTCDNTGPLDHLLFSFPCVCAGGGGSWKNIVLPVFGCRRNVSVEV